MFIEVLKNLLEVLKWRWDVGGVKCFFKIGKFMVVIVYFLDLGGNNGFVF